MGQSGFRGTPCPSEDLVGRCQFNDNDYGKKIIAHSYASKFTLAKARYDCDNIDGTWSP
jgi:hypothetical protein